jgi:hypothetical protein
LVLQLVILFLKKIIKKNMNYKIRITAENQAIVKRIADENGMNPDNLEFVIINFIYEIENNIFRCRHEEFIPKNTIELTTAQFIELFDKKETELDKWLKETKAKNFSLDELNILIENCDEDIYYELKGEGIIEKAQILFNQWNNPTEKSPKVETEWQPKRGDRVLVWDYSYQEPKERIFLSTDGHEDFPILALRKSKEGKFKDKIYGYKHMKPLPIEQPKETDFKTKVIELIETKINDLKGYEKRQIERNEYYNNHSQVASKIKVYNDLINQIKQL